MDVPLELDISFEVIVIGGNRLKVAIDVDGIKNGSGGPNGNGLFIEFGSFFITLDCTLDRRLDGGITKCA